MTLTNQQALTALNNKKIVGFTTSTGNVLMSKLNKTEYNIFIYEEANEEPTHLIGNVTNVIKTMNDKESNKDFIVVEK